MSVPEENAFWHYFFFCFVLFCCFFFWGHLPVDSIYFGDCWISPFLGPATAAAKSLQSCPTLCDPIDGSPPGSPVPGILQARTLELGYHFLLQCMKVKSESEVTQSCLTFSDPMDCSPPDSSVHGIFQARVLEWGAIAFSILGSYLYINDAINLFRGKRSINCLKKLAYFIRIFYFKF